MMTESGEQTIRNMEALDISSEKSRSANFSIQVHGSFPIGAN